VEKERVTGKELKAAFERFSVETSALKDGYSKLQEQFRTVNMRLDIANKKLNAKVLELAKAQEYLNTILTNISQGIIFVCDDGIVTTYNASALAIFGAEDVIDKDFSEVFADDIFGFSMSSYLSRRESMPSSFVQYTCDGAVKDLDIAATYVNAGVGQHAGIIIVVRDITEVRKLRTIANRNDRLHELGEMAASIAHEIRNPLGGIEGFASLLCRDLEDSPGQHKMAKSIVEGSKALNRLVSTVLSYARPTTLEFSKASLKNLIIDIGDLFSADKKFLDRVSFVVDLPNDDIEAYFDIGTMKSAMMNIALNAAQAMPDGGAVTMSLEEADNHAHITVHDNGSGIVDDDLENIFSPFFTTKVEGNGFGLSEAHKTLQAHGGSIEVASVPGDTTFTMKIPLTNATCTRSASWQ
jgi:PAS domain S-box-containing protein